LTFRIRKFHQNFERLIFAEFTYTRQRGKAAQLLREDLERFATKQYKQGCHIFIGSTYQMATKFIKWSYKIYQHLPLQDLPKFTQIVIFVPSGNPEYKTSLLVIHSFFNFFRNTFLSISQIQTIEMLNKLQITALQ
jgi:hypothetical protein